MKTKSIQKAAAAITIAFMISQTKQLKAQSMVAVEYNPQLQPGDKGYSNNPVKVTLGLTVTVATPAVQGIDPTTGLPSKNVPPQSTASWYTSTNKGTITTTTYYQADGQTLVVQKYGNAQLLADLNSAGLLPDNTTAGWSIVAVPSGGGDPNLNIGTGSGYYALSYDVLAVKGTGANQQVVDLGPNGANVLNVAMSNTVASFKVSGNTQSSYNSAKTNTTYKTTFTSGKYSFQGPLTVNFAPATVSGSYLSGIATNGTGADQTPIQVASTASNGYAPIQGTIFTPGALTVNVFGSASEYNSNNATSNPAIVTGTIGFAAGTASTYTVSGN